MRFGSSDTSGVFGTVLLAVVLLGAAGCGHSEEEWEAMLQRQQTLQQHCASGPPDVHFEGDMEPSVPSSPGCRADIDCKGDRICNSAMRCVSPPR